MSEAILPFLKYCVLQLFVFVVGLNFSVEKKLDCSGLLKAWIFGQICLFAALQVVAVPMILLRWQFTRLFWSYIGVAALLFGFGCLRLKEKRIRLGGRRKPSGMSAVILVVALALILYQSGQYLFKMHLDEDDARWLAEANDALEYGDMMLRSFHTGEYLGYPMMFEDVTSPWPMLFAILGRLLNARVAVVAHTIYPAVEILAVYGVYGLMGKELFRTTDARLTFLLLSAVGMLFYGGTVYTQGTFSLVRLWQGKANVAGIMVPFMLYLFVCINKRNRTRDWLSAAVAGAASSMMSGMGIVLGGIMIGVYGMYNIMAYRHWRRIPLWLLSLAPSAVFALIFFYLKG